MFVNTVILSHIFVQIPLFYMNNPFCQAYAEIRYEMYILLCLIFLLSKSSEVSFL